MSAEDRALHDFDDGIGSNITVLTKQIVFCEFETLFQHSHKVFIDCRY